MLMIELYTEKIKYQNCKKQEVNIAKGTTDPRVEFYLLK